MASRTSPWIPDWAVAPGEVLAEALSERNMTQSELSTRLARPLKTVNEIINAKAAITPQTAIQLERALGISADFCIGLEANYRADVARQQARVELEAEANWIDEFPIKELIKRQLVAPSRDKADLLSSLLGYFRVSSPEAFNRYWLGATAAFRDSPAFAASPKAVASWLRWGEIEAEGTSVSAFDPAALSRALTELRTLSRVPFNRGLSRARELLGGAGTILVLIPELPGTHLNGASWWRRTSAVVQLSLRHKQDDQFWFTLFHEIGHLLAGHRGSFVDGSGTADDSKEHDADSFARETLIPSEPSTTFVNRGNFDESMISEFAAVQRIAPGIIVGRLQREGKVSKSRFNDLKRPMIFPDQVG
jgi:HTH-type transcriptional regulator/antitoxin HigA